MKAKILKEWSKELNKLVRTGFFHIFTSQVLNKVITFSSSILIVRILSKDDFGIYSYANNIIGIFLLLNGFGASSGFLQFGSENRNNPRKLAAYSKCSWRLGILANVIILLLIITYTIFFNLKIKGVASILILMSFQPIINYFYTQILMEFRVRLQNKEFSFLSVLNSFLILISTIIGGYFYAIYGIVLIQYVGYFISIVIGGILANRNGHNLYEDTELTCEEKKSFFKLSFVSSMNNAISQMLYLLDIFVIGIIIPNPAVIASYKTATTIPFAMLFVPMAIITYIYPYFASHYKEIEWVHYRYYQLLKRLILLNGIISVGMFIFAPWIIKTIFGYNYMDSIAPFRILSIGYFVAATFRIPSGNILVSMRKVMFNFYNAIISGIANIMLNVILITRFGSIGAAYATVLVYIISSITSTVYLNKSINDNSNVVKV